MIALLIGVCVAFAFVVLAAPAWAEWKHHLARKSRQRFTDPGWTAFTPRRYMTPELQRRLRDRR